MMLRHNIVIRPLHTANEGRLLYRGFWIFERGKEIVVVGE